MDWILPCSSFLLNDGIQRQTIEHLQILRAFEVSCIAIVISKCNLSDESAYRTLQKEVAKLFPQSPEESLPTNFLCLQSGRPDFRF